MEMDLPQSLNTNANNNIKRQKRYMRSRGGGIGFDDNGASYLIVKLPDSKVLTFLARSVLLACIIVSIPWFRSVLERSMNSDNNGPVYGDYRARSDKLSTVYHDLSSKGLFRQGDKALFISNGYDDVSAFQQVDIDRIHIMDTDRQSAIEGDTFDLVVTNGYKTASEFIDKILKMGGILAIHLSKDPSEAFEIPTNYRTVYFRKSDSPIIAMRKSDALVEKGALGGRRRLLGLKSKEEKKAALRKLEDVLLEPPRSASGRSKSYLKKTRYLPDLMGDTLEGYPRRVFIDVGSSPTKVEGDRSTEWFARNYPTRNLEFELYRIETVAEEQATTGKGTAAQTGMSDWLRKNVKEEEYVVMRAEAEVVEEIVKSKAIEMVDELFLDCKPRRCRRAYWECLALYGRLRDEGVAVHQWWG